MHMLRKANGCIDQQVCLCPCVCTSLGLQSWQLLLTHGLLHSALWELQTMDCFTQSTCYQPQPAGTRSCRGEFPGLLLQAQQGSGPLHRERMLAAMACWERQLQRAEAAAEAAQGDALTALKDAEDATLQATLAERRAGKASLAADIWHISCTCP